MTQYNPPSQPSTLKQGVITFFAVIVALPVANFISFLGLMFMVVIIMVASAGSGSDSGGTQKFVYGNSASSNEILSISINGPIYSQSEVEQDPLYSLFGVGLTNGDKVKEELFMAAKNDNVKAVILDINSPGGMINASTAITDGVKYFQEKTKKPVYAYISGLGASGSYWVAASGDKIVSDTGSLTGSIGVILGSLPYYNEPISLGDVTTRQPIKVTTMSAGKYKDVGNPFREITPEEKQMLQTGLDYEYNIFVDYVATRRGIEPVKLRNVIGAGIYSNGQAKEYKLIDSMATREATYMDLAIKAGLNENNYKVVRQEPEGGFLGSLFGAYTNIANPQARAQFNQKICNAFMAKPLALHGNSLELCQKP